jgi:uncharacterized protein
MPDPTEPTAREASGADRLVIDAAVDVVCIASAPRLACQRVARRPAGRPLLLSRVPSGEQNADMPLPLRPPGLRRRSCLLAALPLLPGPARATDVPLCEAMRRAEVLPDEARRAGVQPFGAVVLRGESIVGAAPSRVVTVTDPTAHAEMQDSPFLYAGAQGRLEILRMTLAAGADLKSTNRYGGTALIPAAQCGHVEMVRRLLKTKIDVDHVNRLGWTALLEAIILADGGAAHTEIVRSLVMHRARLQLADAQGVTPLAHAEQRGQRAIGEILRRAGARP